VQKGKLSENTKSRPWIKHGSRSTMGCAPTGLRPTEKPVDESPNPKTAGAAILPNRMFAQDVSDGSANGSERCEKSRLRDRCRDSCVACSEYTKRAGNPQVLPETQTGKPRVHLSILFILLILSSDFSFAQTVCRVMKHDYELLWERNRSWEQNQASRNATLK